jgi:hypothetical protein
MQGGDEGEAASGETVVPGVVQDAASNNGRINAFDLNHVRAASLLTYNINLQEPDFYKKEGGKCSTDS